MFETLFKYQWAVERHRSAEMLDERLRFLRQQAAEGLSKRTLRLRAQYLLVVMDYLQLARNEELVCSKEIEAAAIRWSRRRQTRNCKSRHAFVGHATRWLKSMGRWKPTPTKHNFGEHLTAYSSHMQSERGLAPATVLTRRWTAEDFLPRLQVPLRKVTITDVDATVVDRFSGRTCARASVHAYVGCLRDFFRFAERKHWCRSGIAEVLRGPRLFPDEVLPKGPSWEAVQELIADCNGDEPVNIRDKAILLLLSVYGLRAGKVVRLKLDDFDWNEDRMVVQRSKNHRKQTYPLCRTVGSAIARYLREVRPRTECRELFTTMRPRFRPLSRVALTGVVSRKLKTLNVPLAHYGPHAIRHTCATHLLSKGLSFKEIGDMLGHRLPDTTAIYAKVDISGLREVADFDLGGVL